MDDVYASELFASRYRARLAEVITGAPEPEFAPPAGWCCSTAGFAARLLGQDAEEFGSLLVGSGPKVGGRVAAIVERLFRDPAFATFMRSIGIGMFDVRAALDNIVTRPIRLVGHSDSWKRVFDASRGEELERKY